MKRFLKVRGAFVGLLSASWLLPVAPSAAGVIHGFGQDGSGYYAGQVIMDSAGNLYGTAAEGGAFGLGTVFEMMKLGPENWLYTDIYSFRGGTDGLNPFGALAIDSTGSLYGVTEATNGTGSAGTVFKLSPPSPGQTEWSKTTLEDFPEPEYSSSSPLLAPDGSIYGTMFASSADYGSIYRLVPPAPGQSGYNLTVIYRFLKQADGAYPSGDLAFNKNGFLFGVTSGGGVAPSCGGCGTVYELRPPANGHTSWTLKNLHNFTAEADGNYPDAGVVLDRNGVLYGSTAYGGPLVPGGTVYSLTPLGGGAFSFETIQTFSDPTGPRQPTELTVDSQQNLYGISYSGGRGCFPGGCGTLFKLSPPTNGAQVWTESVLANAHPATGTFPIGLLLGNDHSLYETLYIDGPYNGGSLIRTVR